MISVVHQCQWKHVFDFVMELPGHGMFSLEEDDGKELFITQSDSGNKKENNKSLIFGQPLDYSFPMYINQATADISDDDFEIPLSQNVKEKHQLRRCTFSIS